MAYQVSYGWVIPAPGEEFGVAEITSVVRTDTKHNRTFKQMEEHVRRVMSYAGPAADLGDGWFAPAGSMDWAKTHPGKPIIAAWIEEV